MKYIFLILFFSINIQTCDSQIDYVSYFHKINEAELYIAKNDYASALKIYKNTFKEYPHNFYKDVHNACICAIKIEKQDDIFYFSKRLVLHGYELTDFDKEPFEFLKNNKKLWKNFCTDYPKLRDEYLKTIDIELRKQYYSLIMEDQIAAKTLFGWKLDSIYYVLSGKISELIEKNGFPDWMLNKDTISYKLVGMLLHYCRLENQIKENPDLQDNSLYTGMSDIKIKSLVNNAFYKGLITPNVYATITTEGMNDNPYGRVGIYIDRDNEKVSYAFRLSPKNIEQVNKNRESIGLPIINKDTEDLINTTFWSNYPFKEIKKARDECENCTMEEKMELQLEIHYKFMEEYHNEKPKSHFIINSIQ